MASSQSIKSAPEDTSVPLLRALYKEMKLPNADRCDEMSKRDLVVALRKAGVKNMKVPLGQALQTGLVSYLSELKPEKVHEYKTMSKTELLQEYKECSQAMIRYEQHGPLTLLGQPAPTVSNALTRQDVVESDQSMQALELESENALWDYLMRVLHDDPVEPAEPDNSDPGNGNAVPPTLGGGQNNGTTGPSNKIGNQLFYPSLFVFVLWMLFQLFNRSRSVNTDKFA